MTDLSQKCCNVLGNRDEIERMCSTSRTTVLQAQADELRRWAVLCNRVMTPPEHMSRTEQSAWVRGATEVITATLGHATSLETRAKAVQHGEEVER